MKVAFIGGGNMASAIIGGLLQGERRAADIAIVEPVAEARAALATRFGVSVFEAPGGFLAKVQAVVLAVKPQQMREAAAALAPHLGSSIVISIAAGIRIADLSRWLGGYRRIVRAMPNTPALVHAGITGLFADASATASDRECAQALLASVGETVWFEAESDLDTVTAVSASGPAYVFYLIEALEQAAREMGIAPAQARSLALATFAGATKLAITRGEDPAQLRANVTSKGGTTAAALSSMEAAKLKQHFIVAVKAAAARAKEMGDEFGQDGP